MPSTSFYLTKGYYLRKRKKKKKNLKFATEIKKLKKIKTYLKFLWVIRNQRWYWFLRLKPWKYQLIKAKLRTYGDIAKHQGSPLREVKFILSFPKFHPPSTGAECPHFPKPLWETLKTHEKLSISWQIITQKEMPFLTYTYHTVSKKQQGTEEIL